MNKFFMGWELKPTGKYTRYGEPLYDAEKTVRTRVTDEQGKSKIVETARLMTDTEANLRQFIADFEQMMSNMERRRKGDTD